MNHDASAIPADFYDHEQEPSQGDGRESADWGGDDLFTGTPRRRRFERAARGDHPVGRLEFAARGDHVERLDRPHRRDTMEHPLQRPVARRAAIQARPTHPLELPPSLDPGPTSLVNRVEPAGRRTVTITGHPQYTPARRRPAPTLDERLIGSRPDRVAMYAFALGVLLIVIAFLSANG